MVRHSQRAEATTACSHLYKNVVEAVKLELQTIQASGESSELDVDRIELSLLHDPVLEAASVCLSTSVLPTNYLHVHLHLHVLQETCEPCM